MLTPCVGSSPNRFWSRFSWCYPAFSVVCTHDGAVVHWLSVRIHNAGVGGGSYPARVTMKTPLVRKATGNHFIKSTSLGI